MKHYIGIDIGGTNIRGILWNGTRARATSTILTPRNITQFRRAIDTLAKRLSRREPGELAGIGIGIAGTVKKTRVISSRNIPYLKNFDFRTVFPRGDLRLDNDARAFARAEWLLGGGRGANRILAFTIGTGIGRAYGAQERFRPQKLFEYAEPWERRYQSLRDRSTDQKLAAFLGSKLSGIAADYPAEVIIVGGGVLGRRGFPRRIIAALRKEGVQTKVCASRMGSYAGAIGAALLYR